MLKDQTLNKTRTLLFPERLTILFAPKRDSLKKEGSVHDRPIRANLRIDHCESSRLRTRMPTQALNVPQKGPLTFFFLEKVQGATRLGATGLRASERKSASERVSERTFEDLKNL